VNDHWRLTAGKKELNLGGFEFDYNPIRVIEYSDFVGGLTEIHISAQAAFMPVKGHDLQLEVFNANNNSVGKTYPGADLKRSRHPLGTAFNWTGDMLDGKLQTLWAYAYIHEAHRTDTHYLMLGQKLNLKRWQWFVDYYAAWENVDRHGLVSSETGDVARNVNYSSVISELHYQPTPHWNCMVKGGVEKASMRDDATFKNYRTSYTYQAAVQWIPDLSQDARISLAYVGRKVDYKDVCCLKDYNTDRIELSLIYRIKLY
jgi:hypothetical protein